MLNTSQQTLGKYDNLKEIGRGASAVVYKARDTALDRTVALKVMHAGLLWNPAAVERFLREARAAARLEHPNIVTIYEVGEDQGSYYIAMQYLPGPSVADLIAQGPLPIEQAVDIAGQVADALGYAHAQGFIHRDVKPSNILLNARRQPILTDFGLVKALEWASLSGSGGIVGTPGYIAPEIWEGEKATPATDVYGLGVVLWEMLAGRRLFEGDTPAAIMRKHLVEPPPPLDEVRPGMPAALSRAVIQALAKDASHRYRDMTTLIEALRQPALDIEDHTPEPDREKAKEYRSYGKGYHQKGDYNRAIAYYTKAIELDPNNADFYKLRGVSYYSAAYHGHPAGDYGRAIADNTKAIELDPNNADYYCSRAVSYHLAAVHGHPAGDYDQAIADYNRAIELDPDNADFYFERGLSYKLKGDKANARADFEKGATLGHADARKEIERL